MQVHVKAGKWDVRPKRKVAPTHTVHVSHVFTAISTMQELLVSAAHLQQRTKAGPV